MLSTVETTPVLADLAEKIQGTLYTDSVMRTLYATDASAYREMPLGVVIPETKQDLEVIIRFAAQHTIPLIPRTAGTSLAGQVVGKALIVDVSKFFNKILEINPEESYVWVEPGVVRDVLNVELKKYGLFFGPETSTANRAMIGGMLGNNSCGSNSIVYGSTREHVLEVEGFLSDGTLVNFRAENPFETLKNLEEGSRLFTIYSKTLEALSNPERQQEIREEFPKPSIHRRNTGYALDMLLNSEVFDPQMPPFNFCSLLAGSEGTLCFATKIKLHVDKLPPKHLGLVCAHFNTIDEALRANLIAIQFNPSASELMDHYILECTKANPEQRKNRFFVEGDPGAILVVELRSDDPEKLAEQAKGVEKAMMAENLGYHFPFITGNQVKNVWDLRKAGLGLLSNLPGDEKAVAVIEDTAVDVNDLPAFIAEFNEILSENNLYCVHYAHAGTGELHLRPIINLKTKEGHKLFRHIAEEIARLVKKYKGSLSGEHGDGRLRGEFIPWMVGESNYQLMRELKSWWDPQGIFNPNKIVDTPPMDSFLRYEAGQQTPEFKTAFRYHDQDVLQHAEQCNGSGDCRKTPVSGGTMCPSFMATRNEKETTRARANILREFLTRSPKENRFAHEEIKEVMDLCLACKGCKSECPSNVDVAKLKMEFLYQYQKEKGLPIRSWLVGNFSTISSIASKIPFAYNLVMGTPFLRRIANQIVGFHPERSMPLLANQTLKAWLKNRKGISSSKALYLFVDEFTNFNDAEVGRKAVLLLEALGYEVRTLEHPISGRSFLSKGMLDEAKQLAQKNVELWSELVSSEVPLVGIEPSAILTFRDEYPDLVTDEWVEKATHLAKNALLLEEFIAREMEAKRVSPSQFTQEKRLIKLHGHCQQKSISSLIPAKKALSLPSNYEVQLIPSGCCGMAGSFGYEKEHYDLSMQIGELVLFPTVRAQAPEVIIAASGTSCRHQIHDGTQREAKHAAVILYEALV
ncbi:FAD-binding and (Fe-S)-binding domain-containing protein [Aquirufa rosea]|uniref:FAD-binding oxidoreductase n=1 Tax=Aquirufa rosea TaxID=2509241 RepID=A0A4Q1C0F0_9BACT|nr:FAD-binding and (Fe-S)-binding domain-containing protein [Aquirufa rosea]RXK49793.1 FAD-binding oxidoreductase [Aquirufa rosea]